MPHLIIREPGQMAVTFALYDGAVVGRELEHGIMLSHPHISRQHARFEHGPQGWQLRDLGSANGTLLKGTPVDCGSLDDGDEIQIGPVLLTFCAGEPHPWVHIQASSGETVELDRADRRLRLLFEVTRAIGAIDDPDALLGRMLDAVLHVLGSERAMVALREGSEREARRKILRTRNGELSGRELVVSPALVDTLLVQGKGLIIQSETTRAMSPMGHPNEVLSAMGAPLEVGGQVLGFLYVDDRRHKELFNQKDLDFLNALARLTAAALDAARRYQQAAVAAETAGNTGPLYKILGQSPAMQSLRARIAKYAAAGATNVLIRGESGTGKELVARTLHAASSRAASAFVAVNCAAIPETMLEGELFGYEKGAFTGALRSKRGRFVLANRGTLLLDEIGDLSLPAQAKVLRALQEGEILPLGAEQPVHVDVRVLAATHKDLRREITEGRFREDLFFRLHVVELEVPALRERGDDVLLLAQNFLEAAARNLGKPLRGFSNAAQGAMLAYPWPGNVRELQNEVERAAIHAEGAQVEAGDLSPAVGGRLAPSWPPPPSQHATTAALSARFAALEPMERELVEEALSAARGNLAEAARMLGITRIMMKRRVERFQLRWKDP